MKETVIFIKLLEKCTYMIMIERTLHRWENARIEVAQVSQRYAIVTRWLREAGLRPAPRFPGLYLSPWDRTRTHRLVHDDTRRHKLLRVYVPRFPELYLHQQNRTRALYACTWRYKTSQIIHGFILYQNRFLYFTNKHFRYEMRV